MRVGRKHDVYRAGESKILVSRGSKKDGIGFASTRTLMHEVGIASRVDFKNWARTTIKSKGKHLEKTATLKTKVKVSTNTAKKIKALIDEVKIQGQIQSMSGFPQTAGSQALPISARMEIARLLRKEKLRNV